MASRWMMTGTEKVMHKINGRVARISVSTELLAKALHMPTGTNILQARMTGDGRSVVLLLEHKDLPQRLWGDIIPETLPIITHKREEYIWDWNIEDEHA